jgi:hypothetical protein
MKGSMILTYGLLYYVNRFLNLLHRLVGTNACLASMNDRLVDLLHRLVSTNAHLGL